MLTTLTLFFMGLGKVLHYSIYKFGFNILFHATQMEDAEDNKLSTI